jgi:hypothetical protein
MFGETWLRNTAVSCHVSISLQLYGLYNILLSQGNGVSHSEDKRHFEQSLQQSLEQSLQQSLVQSLEKPLTFKRVQLFTFHHSILSQILDSSSALQRDTQTSKSFTTSDNNKRKQTT